ncbi:MAG: precorrin-6A/cobalt-precorrin-6A reductase [Oceanospirillaceae bacterium]|nr:precorrin-6A/cobalt-precorrin-6A reductase [Oceanospirillaceae bacterium]
MKLLILGGTADARHLATALHQAAPNLELIYSVAGLVRQPQVSANVMSVVSGGFSQFGGLSHYCKDQQIDGILNATHPFSITMGEHAQKACSKLRLKYWRFLRPLWQQTAGDDWRLFDTRTPLFKALSSYQRVLLTLGQVSADELALLPVDQKIWLRTAVAPSFDLPDQVSWIKAIGPFDESLELDLLQQHHIQAIASKNSGGSSTQAKLVAARKLKLPVFMLQRPAYSGPVEESFDQLVERLSQWANTSNRLGLKPTLKERSHP